MNASGIITKYKAEILRDWVARVREQVPAARKRRKLVVEDNVPGLLDNLVRSLDTGSDQHVFRDSVMHGKERAAMDGYALGSMVREYRILLEQIFITVDRYGEVSPTERNQMIMVVTKSIEEATEVFYQMRQREEQRARQLAERLAAELQQEGELREAFLTDLTHDLRNPLASVMLLTSVMKNRLEGDSESVKVIDALRERLLDTDQLLEKMLNANPSESGRAFALQLAEVDFLPRLQRLADAFREQHPAGVVVSGEQPSLKGYLDEDALARAVANLIHNAVKYGDDQPVTVRYAQQGGLIQLEVHNYGAPIPMSNQESIFLRKHRMEKNGDVEGWGLGLSLVQQVTVAHGGRVSLESSSARGTIFRLLIPAGRPTSQKTDDRAAHAE